MNTWNNDLNPRQRAFCEHYAECGNAAEAARKAGYSEKTARAIGQRLLTDVDIREYIRKLQDEAAEMRIKRISQIKAFWSDIVDDPEQRMRDRLRASELLAKSAGAFLPDPEGHKSAEHEPEQEENILIYMPFTERDNGCDIPREKM